MSHMSKYVFGPVPSRRLGFSLGVDTVPAKYCSFDCIYCQIGKTTHLEAERKSFFDPHEVVEEVIQRIKEGEIIDFITFSGSGEPTLNSDLGRMIRDIKKRTDLPVSVITNGSLMSREDVREELMAADVVLPSLDGVSDDIFRYINRPHLLVGLDTIIEGLKEFRAKYRGQIWLEIMMLKDVNDDPEELKKFREVIKYLRPDKVQLNTVTRPPSEEIRGRMETDDLEKVCQYFGQGCEVIAGFDKAVEEADGYQEWEKRVLDILRRRSMNLEDIVKITGASYFRVKARLSALEKEGVLRGYHFGDNIYYVSGEQRVESRSLNGDPNDLG
jgi:wyosine [tRNA(Phe)-imidazoG37] synthetase (radical SAM superfamily)